MAETLVENFGLTPDIIRTETVLSKLPIHNLDKHGRVDIQITKLGPNGQVELKWEVSYSDRYGQAGQLAYKLDTIVIDQRIDESRRPLPERIRIGSLNQIAKELGLATDQGATSRHLKRAFRQNALAGITAKFRYRANDGAERTLEAIFTRYSVVFTGEKFSNGRKADAVYIVLNQIYREVLNNAPVRPLNLEYKKQLTPTAQRFYEIVSYKIFAAFKHNDPLARIAYSEYCTYSAQQRYFDYNHFKKQMYKIHRPHLQSGYITHVHYDETTDEQGRMDWVMCYQPGPKAWAEYAAFTGKRPLSTGIASQQLPGTENTRRRRRLPEVDHPQLAALTDRGVSETQARKILADLPTNFPVLDTLAWGDGQIASQPGKFTNPPGFYISLLCDRSTPPPAFETSEAKTARQEAAIERERAILDQREAAIRTEEAERQQVDARIASLEPEARQALFEQAKADLLAQYPNMALFFKLHPDNAINDGAVQARMRHLITRG